MKNSKISPAVSISTLLLSTSASIAIIALTTYYINKSRKKDIDSGSSESEDCIVSNPKETASSSKQKQQQQQLELITYNPKKPNWWKNVAGCNATKGQKKAMNTILKTNRLPSIPYGSLLNFQEIFPTTAAANANNDIWLEIGFGYGENLLALVHRNCNENISFIGAEIHKPAIGT